MSYDEIHRNGFASKAGRFWAFPGYVERVESDTLKNMFIPEGRPPGCERLQINQTFLRAQLKHYGVEYTGKDIAEDTFKFLQEALREGKCDKVPDHISKLRWKMHMEWLEQIPPEELVAHPKWTMQKYFLDLSGNPDKTKTQSVVHITLPEYGDHYGWDLMAAANKIKDLHHQMGSDLKTHWICLGWDQDAVEKEARDRIDKERRAMEGKKARRDAEHARSHQAFLSKAAQPDAANSPVGSYVLDCEYIWKEWPQSVEVMTLDVHESDIPGVFEAAINHGIFEGVMIISRHKSPLQQYRDKFKDKIRRDYDKEGEYEYSDEEHGTTTTQHSVEDDSKTCEQPGCSKRKADNPRGANKKKTKTKKLSRRDFHLRLRGRETGEGETWYEVDKGMLTFDDSFFTSFRATTDIAWVGNNVVFTGRKISDAPGPLTHSWGDF